MKQKKTDSKTSPRSGSSIPKMRTYVRGLDDILHGGIPTGRVSVFSGKPGTGKTVLALEILCRAAMAGEPGVFVTFEEGADDLRANLAAIGLDLANLEQEGKVQIVEPPIPRHSSAVGNFDLNGLQAMLEGYTRSLDAKLIVIDAIDGLMRVFSDQKREREEFHFFFQSLRERRITTVLTAKTLDERTPYYPFLDFMADCMLSLDQRIEAQIRTRRISVVKLRGSGFMNNEYPFVITDKGFVAMPVSSITLDQNPTGGFVGSGNQRLDTVLGGGYRRGSSVLIYGASGAGKTTLAATFVHHTCRHGEKALYVNLERSAKMLITGMKSVGLDLEPFIESGTMRLMAALPEAAGVEQHLFRILDAIEQFSPDHLVIDSISTFRRMGSQRAAFDFLIRLLMTCRARGITSIYTNQTFTSEGGIQIANESIASIMDTLVNLRYTDDGEKVRRHLLVIKSRNVAHSLEYHSMEISDDGISLPVAEDGGDAGASKGGGR